jgi:Fe/S biogenesis protein NfuA
VTDITDNLEASASITKKSDVDIEAEVRKLLDEQINPALAGHGGGCELISVKDAKVFVELNGGCRGCAMARMTLKNGIERVIKENIPEVEEVVDSTDHADAEDPYC